MHSLLDVSASDRRGDARIRTEMFLNQYVRDQPYRALATNLSTTGLFLQKLAMPYTRHAPSVGLEFELPGTGEIIWAKGELAFDQLRRPSAMLAPVRTSGIRFMAAAGKHLRLIRDYVTELRRTMLDVDDCLLRASVYRY
jgi:hypothetical protein